MVPLLIEIEMRNLLYHISLTLLPDQIKAKWQVRPLHKDPDLDGKEEIFKSYSEYSTWYENLKKTYGKRIIRKGLYRVTQDKDTGQFIFEKFTRLSATKRKGCVLKKEHDNPEPGR
ncbi:MAG: hypothetical protein [Bacteriophage sp.]|nr:MAG: hypothetical protein [Bacteriophage sp.]